MLNFSFYDGIALSNLIKSGEISSVEVVDSSIDVIEQLNPELNAVVHKLYDNARKRALILDSDSSGKDNNRSPLYGIPFLVKDLLVDCNGTPFNDGSRAVRGYISDIDSELIKRLRNAGVIIIGKTNTSEFGVMPTTEPELFGPTQNPWKIGYTPGGSSGGSSAAVASGMVPLAHGSDGGGSLRIPASCCGLFGLKPSRARNPLGPVFGDIAGGIVCEHGLTRSVRDSAALLDITSGPDIGVPYYAPKFDGKYLEEIGKDPEKLKIGFLTEVPEGWNEERKLHTDCEVAVREAAALCENLGHNVEEVSQSQLAFSDLPQTFIKIFSCYVGHAVSYWEKKLNKKITEEMLEPATWDLYQSSLRITGADYLVSWERLQLFSRKIAQWYQAGKWDILLSPVMRIPPTELGAFSYDPDNPNRWILNATSFVAFTRTQNITGQPAMSVPLYWNAEDLPIGVQFAGTAGAEALLFRLAAQLERAHPWINKKPPGFYGKGGE